jgi:hypothetical protein
MDACLIAKELCHPDKTAINQEEATLHGLDPLMDTAPKCPGTDKPKSSLNRRESIMNRNIGCAPDKSSPP